MPAIVPSLMTALASAAPGGRRVPIILDTDIGDDIDDTWALGLLLASPEVDLKLVTTCWGDTEARTQLVSRMLAELGRNDVPIGTGRRLGNAPLAQAQWMTSKELSVYRGHAFPDGVGAMVDMINAASQELIVLALGPHTNLARALDRDPGIALNARVTAMAGSIHTGYMGRPGRMAEYNLMVDPVAARRVFGAPWDITLVPLDICGDFKLTGPSLERVKRSEAPIARLISSNYAMWSRRAEFPEHETSVLFDTAAACLAFDESFCEFEMMRLSIDDEGRTIPDANGRQVRCAMRWKDREGFERMLVERLLS